jgi:hypothetical protein
MPILRQVYFISVYNDVKLLEIIRHKLSGLLLEAPEGDCSQTILKPVIHRYNNMKLLAFRLPGK